MTEYLTLTTASQHLATVGHKASPQSLWRWCAKGCRGIQLKHGRFGRKYVIKMANLDEFITALGALDEQEPQPSTPRKPRRTGPDGPERLEKAQQRLKEKHGL